MAWWGGDAPPLRAKPPPHPLVPARRYGAGFGPSGNRNAQLTYGPAQNPPVDYTTQSCRTFNDSAMSCVSAAGVGANLYWLVGARVPGGAFCVPSWEGEGGGRLQLL